MNNSFNHLLMIEVPAVFKRMDIRDAFGSTGGINYADHGIDPREIENGRPKEDTYISPTVIFLDKLLGFNPNKDDDKTCTIIFVNGACATIALPYPELKKIVTTKVNEYIKNIIEFYNKENDEKDNQKEPE